MSVIEAAQQLAELQGEGVTVATGPVDFSLVLAAAIDGLGNSFAVKNLSLAAPTTKPGLVLARPELLGQSISTLLAVSRKLATTGTAVSACFDESQRHVALKLSFQCHHLSDSMLGSFFENFSKERSSSYVEDMGLTVPVAAHLIRTMGGSVDLRNCPGGGEIVLMLDKAVPDA